MGNGWSKKSPNFHPSTFKIGWKFPGPDVTFLGQKYPWGFAEKRRVSFLLISSVLPPMFGAKKTRRKTTLVGNPYLEDHPRTWIRG